MTATELLARLHAVGGKVWLDGDRVRCSAPAGAITDEIREQLAARKSEIRALLDAAETLKTQGALVPIQPGGTRPPVFGVPGHNGDVFCFVRLAQHLGADQPFFGLQPPGLDGSRPPIERIEDLAAYFVDELRTHQPRGPYYIAGYCLGGVTAFEVARQLRASGQEVSLLALMSSSSPSAFGLTNRVKSEVSDWLRRHVAGARALLKAPPAAVAAWLRRKATVVGRLLGFVRPPAPEPSVVHRQRVERTTVAAALKYVPQEYPGRVVVCLPSRADEHTYDRLADWGRFARDGAEVMSGPDGCHSDVMLKEPAVKVFADYLRERIARSGNQGGAAAPIAVGKGSAESRLIQEVGV